MTSTIQKAIEASREREERLRDAALDADNDPTEAMIARSTLSDMSFEFRFREALAVAVVLLEKWSTVRYPGIMPMTESLDPTPEAIAAQAVLARIGEILEGK